jgi:hypothetical protein
MVAGCGAEWLWAFLHTMTKRRSSSIFWKEIEAHVRRKLGESGVQVPPRPSIDIIVESVKLWNLRAGDRSAAKASSWKGGIGRLVPNAAKAVGLGSAAVYGAAGLILIVLLFTSLRRVSGGVYQDTPWEIFFPHFS